MSLLSVGALHAGYGTSQVVRNLSMEVAAGEMVALLGANGAGKTTTLRAISGLIPSRAQIIFDGHDIQGMHSAQRVAAGLAHIPQGRGTFPDFTVEENLDLGAYTVTSRSQVSLDKSRWFDIFPRLRERKGQRAGLLSGGEQQMLAIARALMSRPRLVMCDEPSLGLAPLITQELFSILRRINQEQRTTMIVVEQNADLTLRVVSRGYVMEAGEVVAEGRSEDLLASSEIQESYLGG